MTRQRAGAQHRATTCMAHSGTAAAQPCRRARARAAPTPRRSACPRRVNMDVQTRTHSLAPREHDSENDEELYERYPSAHAGEHDGWEYGGQPYKGGEDESCADCYGDEDYGEEADVVHHQQGRAGREEQMEDGPQVCRAQRFSTPSTHLAFHSSPCLPLPPAPNLLLPLLLYPPCHLLRARAINGVCVRACAAKHSCVGVSSLCPGVAARGG